MRILNRVIRWSDSGREYKPDQRHAELTIPELGIKYAVPVCTPGTRGESQSANFPFGVDGTEKHLAIRRAPSSSRTRPRFTEASQRASMTSHKI